MFNLLRLLFVHAGSVEPLCLLLRLPLLLLLFLLQDWPGAVVDNLRWWLKRLLPPEIRRR